MTPKMHSSWCDSSIATIIHLLQAWKKDEAAKKCWGKHFSYHILWQLGVKLCWLHMRDHCPSPLLHMAAIMTLIVIPYVDDVLIVVGDMIGGMTHWLDVCIGNETFHTSSCFKGSMVHYMTATLHHLFLHGEIHMIDLCLWEEPLTWVDFFS